MPSLSDLSLHLPGILLAYSVLIIGICSPGPAVLAIIGTALSRGRAPAVQFSLGVVCGSAFWGVAAAVGMTAVLTAYANVLIVLKIAGGLYLLWMAYKSLRQAMSKSYKLEQSAVARAFSSTAAVPTTRMMTPWPTPGHSLTAQTVRISQALTTAARRRRP